MLKFDGFLKVYEEAADEDVKNAGRRRGHYAARARRRARRCSLLEITPRQHFTEPPPRFTEASLVKMLEEKGVGRPSTYASILTTIQDREYVQKDQGKFRPTELGTVVTDLLVRHFEDIFDMQYTARMEEELDEIEEGKMTGCRRWTTSTRSSRRT